MATKPPPPEKRLPQSATTRRPLDAAITSQTEFSKVTVDFDDEFAPSHAEISTNQPDMVLSPMQRHAFYYSQLNQTLADAID